MYYKTHKDSETGRKFAEVYARIEAARVTLDAFLKKYQADHYLHTDRFAAGGVEGLDNVKLTDGWKQVKKNQNTFWVPDKKTKKGKLIDNEVANLPFVTRKEIDACIGFSSHFSRIGACFEVYQDCYYFCFSKMLDNTAFKPPLDCIEVLYSEYLAAEKGGSDE